LGKKGNIVSIVLHFQNEELSTVNDYLAELDTFEDVLKYQLLPHIN
jgi:nitrate reductase NapAB chaperone NapD